MRRVGSPCRSKCGWQAKPAYQSAAWRLRADAAWSRFTLASSRSNRDTSRRTAPRLRAISAALRSFDGLNPEDAGQPTQFVGGFGRGADNSKAGHGVPNRLAG